MAVLGAGIMGASTALFLARRGARVTLFDRAVTVLAGASRSNEGKIHLGYLYAADPSLDTARRLLPGGLAFKALTEELVGCAIDPAVSRDDDLYVLHRASVVGADDAGRYYEAVSGLVEQHAERAGYLSPIRDARPRRLSQRELDAGFDTAAIVAGFRVPERSVATEWVADRFAAAIDAEPRIDCRLRTTVTGVRGAVGRLVRPLHVETDGGVEGPFDAVVNALWDGRLALDASLGLPLPKTWSHRFRLSAFVSTTRDVEVPSAVVATGPFGDVKNYTGRDLYLSWYPTGLVAEGNAIAAPVPRALGEDERARLLGEIVARLGAVVTSVRDVLPYVASARLAGGWVYAAGRGPLDDRASTLHRRDRVGIERTGDYVSVDTGKYSIAPWLARQVADLLA